MRFRSVYTAVITVGRYTVCAANKTSSTTIIIAICHPRTPWYTGSFCCSQKSHLSPERKLQQREFRRRQHVRRFQFGQLIDASRHPVTPAPKVTTGKLFLCFALILFFRFWDGTPSWLFGVWGRWFVCQYSEFYWATFSAFCGKVTLTYVFEVCS